MQSRENHTISWFISSMNYFFDRLTLKTFLFLNNSPSLNYHILKTKLKQPLFLSLPKNKYEKFPFLFREFN